MKNSPVVKTPLFMGLSDIKKNQIVENIDDYLRKEYTELLARAHDILFSISYHRAIKILPNLTVDNLEATKRATLTLHRNVETIHDTIIGIYNHTLSKISEQYAKSVSSNELKASVEHLINRVSYARLLAKDCIKHCNLEVWGEKVTQDFESLISEIDKYITFIQPMGENIL